MKILNCFIMGRVHYFWAFILLMITQKSISESVKECASPIYCKGAILEYVSKSKQFEKDFKKFVDMKLTKPEKEVLSCYDQIPKETKENPSEEDINNFVKDNFEETNELEPYQSPDYKEEPAFVKKIENSTVKEFAKQIHCLWKDLTRVVKKDIIKDSSQYSIIPIPKPFVIPGGRFKEMYYWDSFFTIQGLLVSEMFTTVKNMLENFFYLIKKFGYIPNGTRIYFLERSQPPLLVRMVDVYHKATNDTEFIKKNIDYLETEMQYWLTQKTTKITLDDETYTVARYISNVPTPRPESYPADNKTASVCKNQKEREIVFKALRSAAESGWDFSSRWFKKEGGNNGTLSDIRTTDIIPVDLNSFLASSFNLMSCFYDLLGNKDKANFWKQQHETWVKTIECVFYNKTDGIWYDFDKETNKHRVYFYVSNFSPLYAGAVSESSLKDRGEKAIEYFNKNMKQGYPGGVPTSLSNPSQQQWDWPNAWPPLQSILIYGFQNIGSDKGTKLAEDCAMKWIDTMMTGYNKNKTMYEKYDVQKPGERGAGGEYEVQTGFGWTNGVTLDLIKYFYCQQK